MIQQPEPGRTLWDVFAAEGGQEVEEAVWRDRGFNEGRRVPKRYRLAWLQGFAEGMTEIPDD